MFEDEVPLEQFSTKYDASLFVFGSNSKKHPDCLIFGRLYDFHILDMVELRIENYVSSKEFSVNGYYICESISFSKMCQY